MLTTRDLSSQAVKHSAHAASLSSVGVYDARYLVVNDLYLSLIERIWPELNGEPLVGKGAAISNPERDRRLWLLDTKGYYDCEPASISSATGRIIEVRISAQRIWASGQACDLEYFGTYDSDKSVKKAVLSDRNSTILSSFTKKIEAEFQLMSDLDRIIIQRRLLSNVVEAGITIGYLTKRHPIEQLSTELTKRFGDFIKYGGNSKTGIEVDFTNLDSNLVKRCLLEVAGEIWSLIRFSREPENTERLKQIVEPFSEPINVAPSQDSTVGPESRPS